MALKNLKSLFFVSEEPNTQNRSEESTPVKQDSPPPVSEKPTATTSADQRIMEALQKALDDNNLPGFDYLEFRNALKALEAIIPEEAMRYKSAFATASAAGLSVDNLLKSGVHYKEVLGGERQKFENALNQQIDHSVIAKKQQIAELQRDIESKHGLIEQLLREIEEHQQLSSQLAAEVNEVVQRIEATKHNFQSTLAVIVDQIENDLRNIQKHLSA
jgi:chromosome segregation ATPase